MSPRALSTKLRQLQRGVTRVSPVLLIDAVRPTVHREVLLTSLDFPDYFVDMAHPEDYVVSERRMDPYLIENTVPHHHRLLLRVSLEARPGTFAVMPFVLHTGACLLFTLAGALCSSCTRLVASGKTTLVSYTWTPLSAAAPF